MIREETILGEVVTTTSPQISEQEAIANASFGKYDYDPAARVSSLYQQSGFSRYMNPPVMPGIGMSPPNTIGYGNPVFQYFPNYYSQQQQQPQALKSFIPPCSNNGEYMPTPDWQEKIDKMIVEYSIKLEDEQVANSMKYQSYNYGGYGGYNYYGTPYYSPFSSYMSPVNQEINQVVEEMKSEAKENRIAFNKMIARTAHAFAKEEISEDELDRRYRGMEIETPGYVGMTTTDLAEQNRLARMVPVSNADAYRRHHQAVSDQYHSIIPETAGMQECFSKTGRVNMEYELEEEAHRRKNMAVLYNSADGTYRYFVKAKAAERYAKANNIPLSNIMPATNGSSGAPVSNGVPDTLPTLQQSAKLCDDGTLNITCNFGSHKGETYTVNNSMESAYDKERERFQRFYNSIPGSIYLNDRKGGV